MRWLLCHGADPRTTATDGATAAAIARAHKVAISTILPLRPVAGDANHEACAKIIEDHIHEQPPRKRQRHDEVPVLQSSMGLGRTESRPVQIEELTRQPQSLPSQPLRPAPRLVRNSNAQLGATPTQLLRSYVPVSAKAQCDAARDFMAEQVMQKMGRRVRR